MSFSNFSRGLSPELEALLKIELFDREEVKLIEQKREESNYAIHCQRGEGAENIFNEIEFEFNFFEDVLLRRNKRSTLDFHYDIEYRILKRIVDVYNIILANIGDVQTEKLIIIEHYQIKIGTCLRKMCDLFSNSEHIWQLTARWFIDQKEFAHARKLIYKGLEYHFKSELLYYELFYLQLESVASAARDKDVQTTKTVLDMIMDKFVEEANIDFLFKLLNLVEQYEFMEGIQNEILDAMKTKLAHFEDFWHMLALRELEGKHKGFHAKSAQSVLFTDRTFMENCILVYKEGIRNVSTPLMWTYFLTTLVLHDEFDDQVRLLYLKEAFRLSREKGEVLMDESHVLKLGQLTCDSIFEREELFKWATQYFPKSEKIWIHYLLMFFDPDHQDKIEEIFAKGIQALEEKALPLWLQKIRFYTNYRTGNRDELVEKVRHVYLNGVVNQPKEVIEALQLQYLDWLVVEKGLPSARKAYLSFTKEGLTMECHNKMLKYELLNENPNQDVIQGILGLACKMYGKTDVECWINYIQHLLKIDPSRAKAIYEEALRNLDSDLRSSFHLHCLLLNRDQFELLF